MFCSYQMTDSLAWCAKTRPLHQHNGFDMTRSVVCSPVLCMKTLREGRSLNVPIFSCEQWPLGKLWSVKLHSTCFPSQWNQGCKKSWFWKMNCKHTHTHKHRVADVIGHFLHVASSKMHVRGLNLCGRLSVEIFLLIATSRSLSARTICCIIFNRTLVHQLLYEKKC